MHTVNQASKFSLILVAMFFSLAAVQAQTKTVKGSVQLFTNPMYEPASGAKVCSVAQPLNCVYTNGAGEFSITVPVTETQLKFSVTPNAENPDPVTTEKIPASNFLRVDITWITGA